MNKIEEILQEKGKDVYSVGPDATMMDALKVMTANKVGAVLIIEDGKIRGIQDRECGKEIIRKNLFLEFLLYEKKRILFYSAWPPFK